MPEETPREVIARLLGAVVVEDHPAFQSIVLHLGQYQRQGENGRWEDYRTKMPVELLGQLAEILKECRRNGFISPYVYEGRLKWRRLMTITGTQGDLCTLCERTCERREGLETGRYKRRGGQGEEELKPCWVAKGGAK